MNQKSMYSPLPRAGEEIQCNRQERLRHLVYLANGTNAFSRILKKTNAQISAISGPSRVRSIGDKLARNIEATLGLPSLSLDQSVSLGVKEKLPNVNKKILTLIETMSYLDGSDSDMDLVLQLAKLLARRKLNMTDPLENPDD